MDNLCSMKITIKFFKYHNSPILKRNILTESYFPLLQIIKIFKHPRSLKSGSLLCYSHKLLHFTDIYSFHIYVYLPKYLHFVT